jgi:hypothetical protein
MHAIPLILSAILLCHGAADIAPVAALHQQSIKVETVYDDAKDRTTVRMSPIEISAGEGRYVSVRMSPSFSFNGRNPAKPEIVDFELQTVVRGRLRTDLYVVFLIDGEKVFLSSNRWAVKRPVRGRVWVGEHLVFRMPYETFVKITKATTVTIKFDAEVFSLGESQRQALRDFLVYMKPDSAPTSHR